MSSRGASFHQPCGAVSPAARSGCVQSAATVSRRRQMGRVPRASAVFAQEPVSRGQCKLYIFYLDVCIHKYSQLCVSLTQPDGTEHIKSRWSLIAATLDRDLSTSHDLEAAILAYNTKYARVWKFRALHALCDEMDDEGRAFFFDVTLPGIVRLALQLPEVLECAVPLLRAGKSASVSFTQQQIASLLANAFLCTFPRRNTQKRHSEYRTFPDINFNRLFQSTDRSVLEKLKCLLHYFQRVAIKGEWRGG